MSQLTSFPQPLVRGKGRIEVIFGPMFSGKTTELIRRITRFQIAKFRCLVIKYSGDTRYCEKDVSTHDAKTHSALSTTTLSERAKLAMEYDVIGIDEGQFFGDLLPFAESLANAGKTVIVAALDGTYQREGFGNILDLVPLAESIVKLSAVCMKCFGDASFTQRTSKDVKLELIGGADLYQAVCRDCYMGKVNINGMNRSPLKAINDNLKPSPRKEVKTMEF